jgi:hypothetical protein
MYMKYTVNTSSLQYRTCFAIPQATTEGATYLLPKTNRMLTATTTMAIPRVKIHLVESVEKETFLNLMVLFMYTYYINNEIDSSE